MLQIDSLTLVSRMLDPEAKSNIAAKRGLKAKPGSPEDLKAREEIARCNAELTQLFATYTTADPMQMFKDYNAWLDDHLNRVQLN